MRYLDWNDLKRDSETIRVVCPDTDCKGFTEPLMWCGDEGYFDMPVYPHKDESFKILHCYFGHPNKPPIDFSSWSHVDCSYENCHSNSFNLKSGNYPGLLLGTSDESSEKEFVRIRKEKK